MTPHQTSTPKTKLKIQPSTTILNRVLLITFRRTRSLLYLVRCSTFFEDNEAVIKMITKGRSPIMRHVSRIHRVALDWLFDTINLDPKIQLMYIDTKHQLADILTKGNFTRDEWNNLLHLLNISHCSSLCCAQNFSLTSCPKTMAKRIQEQKEERQDWNLTSTVSTISSSVNHPIASRSPGILKASTGKPDARARRNSKPDSRKAARCIHWRVS